MAREDDLGPRLAGRLTYLLKRALVDLDALHEQHLESSGISARELGVLLFLDGREPESQQQTAARMGIDRTTMVGLLDSLEDKALVARRPDAADRRRNVVVLTDTGRATLEAATIASDTAERELLGELDDREAAQLRELLKRVVSRPS
ncbi:MarR family winged helix-turn-helix transcriptional regulator [Solirubrobacter phytolaccae]|uniref:MarR family winged helix-turn-helix transcriptional regulator n=1 Tax=Solirubrobacter phytolaccae TaxID=1404360 RepID=A0A9X3N4L7_9ACTN|nr:MarR family winged helix-turn-helix transcriptional regulator [Solirubrobacter phytolaccae]MDA0179755.1 MarR family winged helix-turn-helix transcriptional regulator [Solirubrobacter phytolaccae]